MMLQLSHGYIIELYAANHNSDELLATLRPFLVM